MEAKNPWLNLNFWLTKCISYTLGSDAVILIVSRTLSKLVRTSSLDFPSIDRSWPFGSVKSPTRRKKQKEDFMMHVLDNVIKLFISTEKIQSFHPNLSNATTRNVVPVQLEAKVSTRSRIHTCIQERKKKRAKYTLPPWSIHPFAF